MRDLIKSFLSFSWGMSVFGMRQMASFLTPRRSGEPEDPAAASFDAVTRAAEEQMDDRLASIFREGDRLQREMVDRVFGASGGPDRPPGRPPEPSDPVGPVDSGRLSTATFVVLGEGLAAGMSDFGLKADLQRESFPALIARQMRTAFAQPLVQAPGIGDLPGFPRLPVRVPAMMQDTVLQTFPPPAPPNNLSVPGLHLADALELRPRQPIVHRDDARLTAANLILGMPGLISGEPELPTQLEAALRLRPTFVIIELGYAEALEAATSGDPDRLPAAAEVGERILRLISPLRGIGAEVLVMTVPDPMDTAHFSTLDAASRVLRVIPSALAAGYGLAGGDRITVQGLVEIGNQLLAGSTRALPPGCLLREPEARQISSRIAELNRALAAAAASHGALLHDLHGLFRAVRERGISLGSRQLTADFLGGFYSLNGYYPGRTGHAIIAAEVLELLNQAYGARFPGIGIGGIAGSDPVARYRGPGGRMREQLPPAAVPPPPGPAAAVRQGGSARNGWPPPQPRPGRLQLPSGLQQTLPLSKRASYHGDAIRIVHCPEERDARYGSCGDLFFGGLVLYDAHLSGNVHIRFSPPAGDVTRFEVSLGDGLVGDDGVLSAPQFFRWPVLQARVTDAPGFVSSGDLNLATGEVSNLQVFVYFRNSALFGLARANPNFPVQQPIAFPGQYGSSWARFDQRPDGRLDFTFYGSMFLPLSSVISDPVIWALPFSSPDADFAGIPASGMAMHPHLNLSTREPQDGEVGEAGGLLDMPFNTVQELTLFTRNSSFGDQFTLNTDTLGGYGKGRSHVMGRLEVQFGERFGDSVSVAISSLSPGGLLANTVPEPLAAVFPGRLYPGPIGHDEFLRFPLRTYFLDAVNLLDDPFDLAVGAVDLRTGDFLNEVLRRGLIGQDVFFALIRVEPRTPQGSFLFRGPARLESGPRGEPVFRLKAEVHIPYPPGFLFPAPDLATGFTIGPGSALDPFLWMRAIGDERDPRAGKRGEAERVRASTGEEFSYRYSITADPSREASFFEYTNHSQQEGTFRLTSLAWASFLNSLGSRERPGEYDTVTFAGYGTWSLDGGRRPHAVTAQISTTPEWPYVSIQIDGGLVSNVNTKPADERVALP